MKYSIIIPVHNVEMYIEECLESIIAQSYSEYEVICVVNASTDRSESICKKYEKNYRQVKCLKTNIKGVSNARNFGISESTGEIIWFVDGDDLLVPDALKKADEIFAAYNPDIAIFGYQTFGGNSLFDVHKYSESGGLKKKTALNGLYNSKKWSGYVWNKLFKRNVLLGVAFDSDIDMIEDLLFTTKVFLQAEEFYVASDILYMYRQRSDSISHEFSEKKLTTFEAYERLLLLLQGSKKDYKYAIDVIGNAKCDFSRWLLCYYDMNDKESYRKNRKKYSSIIIRNYHSILTKKAKIGALLVLISPKLCRLFGRK